MDFIGWIYDSIACPVWTKVFDISIEQNPIFTNCPWDALNKALVSCDLAGYVKDETFRTDDNDSGMFLDHLFWFCGVNLKNCYNTRSQVMIDGQPTFAQVFTDKPVSCEQHSVGAQITVINSRFVYFNMTGYAFWDPLINYIGKEFHTINLGGWLIEVNHYPMIKKFLFEGKAEHEHN